MVLVKCAARLRAACAISLLLSVLVVASVRPVHAAAFIVNDPGDGPDAAPGNGLCATAGAVCALRAAIMEANALAGADSVSFANTVGTVTLTSSLPQVTEALTITGRGAGTTIVDGASANQAFNIAAATTVAISSLTVQHALALSGPALNNQGTVTLTSVIFTLNRASAPGLAAGGGAITNTGTLTITGSTVSGNSAIPKLVPALGSVGGGINNVGTLTMSLSHVTGNTATVGGGVANTGTFSATDSDFTGNTAAAVPALVIPPNLGGIGGGITSSAGSLILNRVTVSGNTAQATVAGTPPNVPGQGGGVMVSGGAASFSDVTVSGNAANPAVAPPFPDAGGGIMITGAATAILVNDTIASNSAGTGANLNGVTASLKNVILSDPLGGGANCGGAPTDAGHNLDSANSCGFVAVSDIVNGSANLGPLASNGGPTQTHALGAGSQAIDAGDNLGCPAVDQRGVVRPLGAACDIGAFESTAPPPAITPTLTPTPTIGLPATGRPPTGGGLLWALPLLLLGLLAGLGLVVRARGV